MPSRLLFILLLVQVSIHAQDLKKTDSARARLVRDSMQIYRRTIAKPYLKVENRRSFIIAEPVNFYGFLAGATFHEKHTIAAGFYFLGEDSRREIAFGEPEAATQQIIRMNYFKLVYQLVILNKRFVQLNVPAEIGAGRFYASTRESFSAAPRHHAGLFVPVSAGVQVIGKITRWLGLSASGGYRYVTNADVLLRFNGPYYSFGLWVDARQVYRDHRYRRAKKRHGLSAAARAAK